ncbi:MAG: hypothetical protein BZY87_03425 [SAR202 cluster bacterium Io17-Chloro-G6]|nr:MAG: hypothetical protein BZY87_03425 [SAR202 cluster bacterium Io17-Chloro-G6]
MDSESIRKPGPARLKRDLGQEAVSLALQGEWLRSTEVNKAILELFPDDVEAMNRLVKALIELGSYVDARAVLDRVCETAPYNKIAKKNRARLDQLAASPGAAKQAKKNAGAPPAISQVFIEESGKSGTTVLRNTTGNKAVIHVSSSDQVVLSPDKNTVTVRTLDGQLLGQVEPKLGSRLARLMSGGNKYTAAVVTVNEQGVSIIIRETFKHASLGNVCSFPSKVKKENRALLNETVARFLREDDGDVDPDADEDDDDENIIDEEAIDTGWSEDE